MGKSTGVGGRWFSSSFVEGFTCVPLLSRCKLLQDAGRLICQRLKELYPFRSPNLAFLTMSPSFSPFPLFFSNWRMWETRERRSWRDEKKRTISVPFIPPIASCAAELKICNLVSKSISTLSWPTEQSQTIQFQFKSLLLALF